MKEILKIPYLSTTQDPVFGYTDKKSIDSDLAVVKTLTKTLVLNEPGG